jgi:hypothetical protein
MGSISYAQYCTSRGYKPPFKGWSVIRRSLFESWVQPGFHRFWRVWNPPVGYLLFRFYILLGGNRNRLFSTSLVFALSGALHDVVVFALVPKWGPIITCSYLVFGWLSLLNLKMERLLRQDKWPPVWNAILNLGLIIGVFETLRRCYWHFVAVLG